MVIVVSGPYLSFIMKYKTLTPGEVEQVIALHKAGIVVKDIARQTRVKVRTVQRLIKRFKDEGGVCAPHPKPKAGRPRKVSQRTIKVMKRHLAATPKLTARQLKEKNPHLLADVSIRTIQQRIHEDIGFGNFKSRPKPLLTPRNMQNRVKFCTKYEAWTEDDWKEVLWMDEATFFVSGSHHNRVYRPRGSDPYLPQYTVPTVKHPQSVMVWGSFAYGGVGELIMLPKNIRMNQYNYYELLNDVLEDSFEKSGGSFLMQDGAPCHTAKSVVTWLKDAGIPYFHDWPGQSPDLNPIENLWAIIKRRLWDYDTSTMDKLQTAIREVWDNFPSEMLHNLALSLPKRLKACKKKNGGATKY